MLDQFRLSEFVGAVTRKLRPVHDSFTIHHTVEATFRDRTGRITSHSITHNLRTNLGADFWDAQLFKVAAAGATANYIALTTDVTAPAATDTTLTSEETLNGLARAQAADAHTAGTNISTLSKTFTYTGSTTKTIAKVGLFNAASSGTMVLETLLGSSGTVNANGDTLTIQWQCTY
jgi:hypothetical protein